MKLVIATISLACLVTASSVTAATIYTYDDLGRVATVIYDNGKEIIYTYDPAGNRTEVVVQHS